MTKKKLFTPTSNFNAFKCKLVEGFPNHLLSSLHTLSKLAFSFVFMFSIYILHVTSCEPKKEIEDASQCCNNSISMVISLCIVGLAHFLHHCCNDIHVDLRADVHYEGLVHCEHEVLN
jgi:hypothetical protein